MKDTGRSTRPGASGRPNRQTTLSLAFEKCLKIKAEAENKKERPNSEDAPSCRQTSQVNASQTPSPAVADRRNTVPKPTTKRDYIPPQEPDRMFRKPTRPSSQIQRLADESTPPSSPAHSSENLRLAPAPPQALMLNNCPLIIKTQGTNAGKKNRNRKPLRTGTQPVDGRCEKIADIVIGFDFGTSSSKVVIQDIAQKKAYAVPFGDLACSANTYLIPTRIHVDPNGRFSLVNVAHERTDIKMRLLDNPDQPIFQNAVPNVSALELAAAYVGRVLQSARNWFLEYTRAIYTTTHIHWHINLGVPSRNYVDINKRKCFRTVAMAAWPISQLPVINAANVKTLVQQAAARLDDTRDHSNTETIWLHPDYVNTHPEVVTEVAGYVFSPLRNPGLHLLVDIGASTLDLATFVIHQEDGENQYPLLETEVKRMGALALHDCRVQAVKHCLETTLQAKNTVDPLEPLPDPDYYGVKSNDKVVAKSDEAFFSECSELIGKIIRTTKNRRDPHSPHWKKGLPVFVCGGGSHIDGYRNMIKERGETIQQRRNDIGAFRIMDIPMPDENTFDAPNLLAADYNRLAVAYGLSFNADDIGKVIPSGEIIDITDQKIDVDIDKIFIGNEQC